MYTTIASYMEDGQESKRIILTVLLGKTPYYSSSYTQDFYTSRSLELLIGRKEPSLTEFKPKFQIYEAWQNTFACFLIYKMRLMVD